MPDTPPEWTTTRELRLDGPVVIAQTRTDPGDMGDPRVFESEGITYVCVPDFDLWPVIPSPLKQVVNAVHEAYPRSPTMPDTLSREEIEAIRERDAASYSSIEDDPDYRPPYLMSAEGHSYTLADRRALLAHIDALTAAVAGLHNGAPDDVPSPALYWDGWHDALDKAVAILRGAP